MAVGLFTIRPVCPREARRAQMKAHGRAGLELLAPHPSAREAHEETRDRPRRPQAEPDRDLLAGHLFVLLVERLAVVRKLAAPHGRALARAHLREPVRVRERLPRAGHDVAVALGERALGEREAVDAACAHDGDGESCVAEGRADRSAVVQVATEGAARVRAHRGHALVPARTGVRIRGVADLGLRGVVELSADGDRDEVAASAGEFDSESSGFLNSGAAIDGLVAEHPKADDVLARDRGARGGEHLERRAQTPFERASVAVLAGVRRGQQRGHRVGVRVVQLDAVEPRALGPARGVGEERRELLGQRADVREVRVGDALAGSVAEVFELARGEHSLERAFVERGERLAQGAVVADRARIEPGERAQTLSMTVGHLEKSLKELRGLGPAPDREKVDELYEEQSLAAGRLAHGVGEPREAVDVPIVADAQEGAGRDVAHARRFDDDDPRAAAGEARVPVDHAIGDEALVAGAPGDHRGDPRAGSS
jgi:hypothetical protein